MYGEIFLIVLALIWVFFASVQDFKKRIVSDWLSFSFIIFALFFRFFYSLFESDGFVFFYQGIFGFLIFFALGNILYYARFFGGGDAKLMMAFGAVLPLTNSFYSNIEILITFFVVFLFAGSFYGLFWSVFVIFYSGNFKLYGKEFIKETKKSKFLYYFLIVLGLVFIFSSAFDAIFLYFGIFVLIIPLLYFHSKVVDNSFLVKRVKTSDLEEGDWIYKDIKLKGKILSPSWSGLNKTQIREIKKIYKTIQIRHGIPFVPVFLMSLIVVAYLYFNGIWFNIF